MNLSRSNYPYEITTIKLAHDEISRDVITAWWIYHTIELLTMKLPHDEIIHDEITHD